MCVWAYKYTHTQIDRKNPPPPGEFPIYHVPSSRARRKRTPLEEFVPGASRGVPPPPIFNTCFEGGPFPPGSWWGNIVNKNPPRGGGYSFDQSVCNVAKEISPCIAMCVNTQMYTNTNTCNVAKEIYIKRAICMLNNRTHLHTHAHAHAHARSRTRTLTHIYTYKDYRMLQRQRPSCQEQAARNCWLQTYKYICKHIYIYMYTYMRRIYVYIHIIYVHTRTHTRTHVYWCISSVAVFMEILTYMYTYIHVQTHTHTHTKNKQIYA